MFAINISQNQKASLTELCMVIDDLSSLKEEG